MITSFFLNIFTTIFGYFVGLLPDANLPTQITDTLAKIGGIIGLFAWLFPVDTIYEVVVIGIILEATIFTLRWGIWLYNKIRGSG